MRRTLAPPIRGRVRYRPHHCPRNRDTYPTVTGIPLVALTATTELLAGESRVHVHRAYVDALTGAGLAPVILPPILALAGPVLDHVAGIVITGGEDVDPRRYGAAQHPTVGLISPERDELETAVARRAQKDRIPLLAICRGLQVVNVALGGTLVQDIPSEVGTAVNHSPGERGARVHGITVAGDSRLARTLGAEQLRVNSLHHQSIARTGDPLRATAHSSDGVIEAAEARDPDWWMLGVQWHPEELLRTPEDWDRRLLAAFAAAVRAGVPSAAAV